MAILSECCSVCSTQGRLNQVCISELSFLPLDELGNLHSNSKQEDMSVLTSTMAVRIK